MTFRLSHIILLLIPCLLMGQEENLYFENYHVPDGLPEGNIQDIIQDDQGFIWFGTQAGLVKYDGYDFKVYKGDLIPNDTLDSYLNDCNGRVMKTRDGKIWVGTRSAGSIYSFDPVYDKFELYQPFSNLDQSEEVWIHLIGEDSGGYMWFYYWQRETGQNAIGYIDPLSNRIKLFPDKDIGGFNRLGDLVHTSHQTWILDQDNNLSLFNRQKDSFEIVFPGGAKLSSYDVIDTLRTILPGVESRLTMTSDLGFYVLDTEKKEVLKSYLKTEFSSGRLSADWPMYAFEDDRGHYVVVHWGGKLSMVDPNTDQVVTYTYGQEPLFYDHGPPSIAFFEPLRLDPTGFWSIGIIQNSRTFFLCKYDYESEIFKFYDSKFNIKKNETDDTRFGYSLQLVDKTGLWWLGGKPGLFKQAPKNNLMDHFHFDKDDPNTLPDDAITSIFEDSNERLWVGTSSGLAIYQPKSNNFIRFLRNSTNTSSLSHDYITFIHEDSEGGLWIGTDNGLNLWLEESQTFRRFFYSRDGLNPCQYLYTDLSGRLWAAMNNEGILELSPGTGKILKEFQPLWNPQGGRRDLVASILQDSRRKLWVGTRWNGLYCLNNEEDRFIYYVKEQLGVRQIRQIMEDSQGRLLIGTNLGGVNQYVPGEDRFFRLSSDERLGSIQGFAYDLNGSLWLATYSGAGLVKLDDTTGKFIHFGEEKGLLHNDIITYMPNLSLAVDNAGKFYIPTHRGLSVFDPESKSFHSFFEADGFQKYSQGYYAIKRKNGEIWIGGEHGLNRIVPEHLMKSDSSFADMVITAMSINDSIYSRPDGRIFSKAVSYTGAIELKHGQKDITFEYVYLHYLRSEDNLYSWKLENYSDSWSVPSKERKTSFTNLSPGTYIFKVKGANTDGIWNEVPASMTITILPPWWKTWWAYGLYALMLAYLGWRIHRYQQAKTIRLERDKAMERELEQAKAIEKAYNELEQTHENLKATQAQLIQAEKMASLGELTAGIAHEIQNPLNFVNNFSEVSNELIDEMKEEFQKGDLKEGNAIAADIKQNLEKIRHHGQRADSIVKGMLAHSRTSTGIKVPTNLNELADEYLRLAYHGLRAKESSFVSAYETNFDNNLPRISVVPQDIGRVLLNLINNAFQAVNEKNKNGIEGYAPKVIVETKKVSLLPGGKEGVQIAVIDNGPGIPDDIKGKIFQPFFTTKAAGQGTGLGLSLSYDIVKSHGGTLQALSGEEEGSEFIIQLPV